MCVCVCLFGSVFQRALAASALTVPIQTQMMVHTYVRVCVCVCLFGSVFQRALVASAFIVPKHR